ncbi:MAG: hypothetical protein ACPGO3_13265 [Magnetospiraceae bacterium]
MKIFFKAMLPVVAGVFVAGLLMNALRDNEIVDQAISGFDS